MTYTHLLLADPPDEVLYDTYEEALNRGTLVEHGRRSSVKLSSTFFSELFMWCFLSSLNWGRRQRILFWEPFRFYSVKANEYDLVHLHMFGVGFKSIDCPLVVSNSVSHHYLYRDARKFSRTKLSLLESAERFLCQTIGLVHPTYRMTNVNHAIAFTEFMKSWYIENSLLPPAQVCIIPPYLPLPEQVRGKGSQMKIGFTARDFDVKGGPALLDAFELVKEKYPNCILHIVGSKPRMSADEAARRNIIWDVAIDRDKLVNEILPSLSVFAYPTNFDGFPMGLLDVMSFGIPTVCSNYPPITELIEHQVDGLICFTKDTRELADNLISLLDPVVNQQYAENSLRRFRQRFLPEVVKPKIFDVYSRAVNKVS